MNFGVSGSSYRYINQLLKFTPFWDFTQRRLAVLTDVSGQPDEIYLLIKYIKSVLWRVAKCLSYIEEAWCLKVNSALIILL